MAKPIDLLCVAGVCVDLIFAGISFIPKAGEEAYGEDFVIKGGGGANTPVAAAKLGLKTAMATLIGTDAMGDTLLTQLKSAGVMTHGVVRSAQYQTSVSSVMSLQGGERAFASYDKLDMSALPLDQLEDLIAASRHVHTYVGYCMSLPILPLAQRHGCTVSLDMGYIEHEALSRFAPYLERAHIFCPNEQEACHLSGEADVSKAAEKIGMHVPILLIKLGGKGALMRYRGETILVKGVHGISAVDTTGAGDNFIAGFLYGYLRGLELRDCVSYANASGALSVTFTGGMDEGYTRQKVEALRQLD